jgi:CheY-like chemotaxis protein
MEIKFSEYIKNNQGLIVKKILALDDNHACLELMERFLEPADCEFCGVVTGVEFREFYDQGMWDLIILDIHIPDLSVLDELVSLPVLESKLLFITGYPEALCASAPEVESLWHSHFQRGNADILYKPFGRQEFHCKVAPLLGEATPICQLSYEQMQGVKAARIALAKHWIDIGRVFITVENGVVMLDGELRYLPDSPGRMGYSITNELVVEILKNPFVVDVKISAGAFVDESEGLTLV